MIELENKNIESKINLNKGHDFVKRFGPKSRRIFVHLLTFISLLAFPVAIILFFYVKWYFPIIMIFTSLLLMRIVRRTSARFVVRHSTKDKDFYLGAVNSETMLLFSINNQS